MTNNMLSVFTVRFRVLMLELVCSLCQILWPPPQQHFQYHTHCKSPQGCPRYFAMYPLLYHPIMGSLPCDGMPLHCYSRAPYQNTIASSTLLPLCLAVIHPQFVSFN